MIGRQLVEQLAQSDYYSEVVVLTRKTTFEGQAKITEKVIDFDNISNELKDLPADHVYCCLGTTMKQAGSKEAFYKVDFTYPLELAQITHRKGAKKFLIVTALGANYKSLFYYNRVKGEIERALETIGFASLSIFRPSLLLGERKEVRAGEEIAQKLYNALGFLFIGPLKKYRGILGKDVATVMLEVAKRDTQGTRLFPSDHIQEMADQAGN